MLEIMKKAAITQTNKRVRNINSLLTYLPTNILTSKKFAFTLAEVLITLGIIGVVAALTMPSLVAKYQKQVLVTQLKKEVNVIQNNLRSILAEEGVEDLAQSSYFEASDNGEIYAKVDMLRAHFQAEEMNENTEFAKLTKKFFGNDAQGNSVKPMYFKDGSCFAFVDNYSEGDASTGRDILIDTNCDKKPNKIGKDMFLLAYNDQGLIVPLFGNNDSPNLNTYLNMFCSEQVTNLEAEDANFENIIYGGGACYQKILNNNWKIPSDYPW